MPSMLVDTPDLPFVDTTAQTIGEKLAFKVSLSSGPSTYLSQHTWRRQAVLLGGEERRHVLCDQEASTQACPHLLCLLGL